MDARQLAYEKAREVEREMHVKSMSPRDIQPHLRSNNAQIYYNSRPAPSHVQDLKFQQRLASDRDAQRAQIKARLLSERRQANMYNNGGNMRMQQQQQQPAQPLQQQQHLPSSYGYGQNPRQTAPAYAPSAHRQDPSTYNPYVRQPPPSQQYQQPLVPPRQYQAPSYPYSEPVQPPPPSAQAYRGGFDNRQMGGHEQPQREMQPMPSRHYEPPQTTPQYVPPPRMTSPRSNDPLQRYKQQNEVSVVFGGRPVLDDREYQKQLKRERAKEQKRILDEQLAIKNKRAAELKQQEQDRIRREEERLERDRQAVKAAYEADQKAKREAARAEELKAEAEKRAKIEQQVQRLSPRHHIRPTSRQQAHKPSQRPEEQGRQAPVQEQSMQQERGPVREYRPMSQREETGPVMRTQRVRYDYNPRDHHDVTPARPQQYTRRPPSAYRYDERPITPAERSYLASFDDDTMNDLTRTNEQRVAFGQRYNSRANAPPLKNSTVDDSMMFEESMIGESEFMPVETQTLTQLPTYQRPPVSARQTRQSNLLRDAQMLQSNLDASNTYNAGEITRQELSKAQRPRSRAQTPKQQQQQQQQIIAPPAKALLVADDEEDELDTTYEEDFEVETAAPKKSTDWKDAASENLRASVEHLKRSTSGTLKGTLDAAKGGDVRRSIEDFNMSLLGRGSLKSSQQWVWNDGRVTKTGVRSSMQEMPKDMSGQEKADVVAAIRAQATEHDGVDESLNVSAVPPMEEELPPEPEEEDTVLMEATMSADEKRRMNKMLRGVSGEQSQSDSFDF